MYIKTTTLNGMVKHQRPIPSNKIFSSNFGTTDTQKHTHTYRVKVCKCVQYKPSGKSVGSDIRANLISTGFSQYIPVSFVFWLQQQTYAILKILSVLLVCRYPCIYKLLRLRIYVKCVSVFSLWRPNLFRISRFLWIVFFGCGFFFFFRDFKKFVVFWTFRVLLAFSTFGHFRNVPNARKPEFFFHKISEEWALR